MGKLALAAKITRLARLLRYIDCMKRSMIAAIAAPISSAIHMRVWLKKRWSSAYVLRYIRANITTVEVATIAASRT